MPKYLLIVIVMSFLLYGTAARAKESINIKGMLLMFDDININIYSLFPLLGSVANFSLFLLVYLKNKKNPVNITFALLNLCLAIWNFGLFKTYSPTSDKDLALFWCRITFFSIAFIPTLFLHFALVITNNFTRGKKKLVFAAYTLSLVFAIIAICDGSLFHKTVRHYTWGYYPVSGSANSFYNVVYIFCSVYGCYLLFKEYRATTSAIRKNQFKYLLWGVSIALLGGMFNVTEVVHATKIYPVGNMINLLYSLMVTYAIVRYRLMEIHVLLKRGVIYLTAFVLAVAVLFFILNFSLEILGPGEVQGVKLFLCLVVAIFVFVFFRLYPKIHNSVVRVFSPEKSDSITMIEQLGNQILSKAGQDMDELIKDTFEGLTQILDLSGGCLFLREDRGKEYDVIYMVGCCCENSENNGSIPYDSSLIDVLSAQGYPIVKEELELRAGHGTSGQSEKKLLDAAVQLDEFRVAVCIPLITRELIIGLLNLGPKKSGRLFSQEELNKLAHLGNQIATALDHAKLLKEAHDAAKLFEESRDAADEMSGYISHKVGTSIATIKRWLEIFDKEINDPKHPYMEFLQPIREEVELLADKERNIKNGLACLAKLRVIELERGDLNSVVEASLAVIRKSQKGSENSSDIEVKTALGNLPPIRLNFHWLKEAVDNLINNAIQAMPNGGKLTIETESAFNWVILRITDTGHGISEAHKPKIFTPWFTTKKEGLGIGLCMVKDIVVQHKGTIQVQSRKGEGTQFTLRFPQAGGKNR